MSPIEQLVADVGNRLALGPEAGSLVKGLLQLVFGESKGLKGFLDLFTASGLGPLASSWLGKSDNPPLSPQGAGQVFGGETIAALAQKAGIDPGVTQTALAFLAPKLIGLLTPGGAIPAAVPAAVTAFLSGVPAAAPGAAAAVAATAAPDAKAGMFRTVNPVPPQPETGRGEDTAGLNRFIFPAVAALLAAAFIYHFWTNRAEQAAPPPPAQSGSMPAADTAASSAAPATATATAAAVDFSTLSGNFSGQDLARLLNQIVLNFDTGSAVVDASGKTILVQAAALIVKLPPQAVVHIDGYTDGSGDPAANVTLSQHRADAVRQTLVEAGVKPASLIAKGHGAGDAATAADGSSNRAARRIEFSVVQ